MQVRTRLFKCQLTHRYFVDFLHVNCSDIMSFIFYLPIKCEYSASLNIRLESSLSEGDTMYVYTLFNSFNSVRTASIYFSMQLSSNDFMRQREFSTNCFSLQKYSFARIKMLFTHKLHQQQVFFFRLVLSSGEASDLFLK